PRSDGHSTWVCSPPATWRVRVRATLPGAHAGEWLGGERPAPTVATVPNRPDGPDVPQEGPRRRRSSTVWGRRARHGRPREGGRAGRRTEVPVPCGVRRPGRWCPGRGPGG